MQPSKALDRELSLELDAARVYGILLFALKRKKLVSYVDLAKSLGMFSGGRPLAEALGRAMEISIEEEKFSILPAIVTRVILSDQGRVIMGPGDGFYEKIRSLGYQVRAESTEEKYQYWLKLLEGLGYDPEDLTLFDTPTPIQDSD